MIKSITVHTFSNGAAILDFGEQTVTPDQVERFRAYWNDANKKPGPVYFLGSVPVVVVDHPNPLGPDHSFDAISHAFRALGEYKEDHEIDAFVEALKTYEAES